ncbi:hypothetical protein [Streptomyces aureoversilis]|uniref:Uncharacterized protein n=1 Tax=Streptomyces aureoversilis TaxID=67277 RepID=A0ABV9ZUX0_9ACTN
MSGEARVRTARNIIVATWEASRDPLADAASEAAQALEDAGLLQSPEVAAEMVRLRELELAVYVAVSELASLVAAAPSDGLTTYEARYEGQTLRPYTSLGAAQQHCEEDARRLYSRLRFVWAGDELLMRKDGELVATGHTVAAVPVASFYGAKGA